MMTIATNGRSLIYGRLSQLTNVPGFPHSPPQVLSVQHPKAYLFRNFLTAEECDHLITLAKVGTRTRSRGMIFVQC